MSWYDFLIQQRMGQQAPDMSGPQQQFQAPPMSGPTPAYPQAQPQGFAPPAMSSPTPPDVYGQLVAPPMGGNLPPQAFDPSQTFTPGHAPTPGEMRGQGQQFGQPINAFAAKQNNPHQNWLNRLNRFQQER